MTTLRNSRIAGPWAPLLLASLALALGTVEVRADQIFVLSGVTFDDGGTATGTFTTNDALDSLLSFDITTSPGTGIGFNYTSSTADASSTSLPFILVFNTPLNPENNILQLTFTNLTVNGALITLGTNDSFEQTPNARRVVISGRVINALAIPEPSSLSLAGTAAVAGLGLCARKRRRI
ncbi:MAG: hypothetical protein U0790_13115 [Isosphaeraceae bacterium]